MAPSWRRDHHLSQGFVPMVWRQKTPTTLLHTPKEGEAGRLRKPEEPARGAYRGELYLLVPPCDLILTAALDKVAKEKVEDSKESSLILTIAVDNRD